MSIYYRTAAYYVPPVNSAGGAAASTGFSVMMRYYLNMLARC